ncbi:MAG TPA: hypothetical protein VFA45_09580 [Actinomycetes bacterium]|jgi:hypothetical protein|nr:hypothetical protein [Actinomycetes bacterium]
MRRHDFDPIAFIFGVVFAGLGVVLMTGRLDLLNHAQWLWPGLLVLLGLAVLVGARGRGGARASRPAFRQGSGVDSALEDELLHSPMRTIDSEHLMDTSSLFTLRYGSRGAAVDPKTPVTPVTRTAPAEEAEEGEGAEREEDRTESLPRVDQEADTELLPPRRREEPGRD